MLVGLDGCEVLVLVGLDGCEVLVLWDPFACVRPLVACVPCVLELVVCRVRFARGSCPRLRFDRCEPCPVRG